MGTGKRIKTCDIDFQVRSIRIFPEVPGPNPEVSVFPRPPSSKTELGSISDSIRNRRIRSLISWLIPRFNTRVLQRLLWTNLTSIVFLMENMQNWQSCSIMKELLYTIFISSMKILSPFLSYFDQGNVKLYKL